jgi:hypothetical protein
LDSSAGSQSDDRTSPRRTSWTAGSFDPVAETQSDGDSSGAAFAAAFGDLAFYADMSRRTLTIYRGIADSRGKPEGQGQPLYGVELKFFFWAEAV